MASQYLHQFWEVTSLHLREFNLQKFAALFNVNLALLFIICSNGFLSKLLICNLKNKHTCHSADTLVKNPLCPLFGDRL